MADVFANLENEDTSNCNSNLFHRWLALRKSNTCLTINGIRGLHPLLPIGKQMFYLLVNIITLTKRGDKKRRIRHVNRFAKLNKPLKFYIEKDVF